MKKIAIGLILLAVTSMSFAAGCWRNGKFVNVCAIDVPQESTVQL